MRLSPFFGVCAMAFVGIAATAARPGHACSCDSYDPIIEIAPADDATVPTDTKIWVGRQRGRFVPALIAPGLDQTFALVRVDNAEPDDEEVIALYKPEFALPPNEEFIIVDADIETDEPTVEARFFTGPGPSAGAPAVPVVEEPTGHTPWVQAPGPNLLLLLGGACPGAGGSTGRVTFSGEGVLHVLSLEEEEPGAPDHPNLPSVASKTQEKAFYLGGACPPVGTNNRALRTETIRVGSYDIAGNFSGWSPAVTLTYPIPGCACVTASPRAAWPTLAAFLLLLPALRRRRAPPPGPSSA